MKLNDEYVDIKALNREYNTPVVKQAAIAWQVLGDAVDSLSHGVKPYLAAPPKEAIEMLEGQFRPQGEVVKEMCSRKYKEIR